MLLPIIMTTPGIGAVMIRIRVALLEVVELTELLVELALGRLDLDAGGDAAVVTLDVCVDREDLRLELAGALEPDDGVAGRDGGPGVDAALDLQRPRRADQAVAERRRDRRLWRWLGRLGERGRAVRRTRLVAAPRLLRRLRWIERASLEGIEEPDVVGADQPHEQQEDRASEWLFGESPVPIVTGHDALLDEGLPKQTVL